MNLKVLKAISAMFSTAALLWASPSHALPMQQGTWLTTLQARDLNGDTVTDAFYDTALNITWLRDANVNGAQTWANANSWANALSFGGYSDWRLPTMVDTGTPGCNGSGGAGGTDCGYNVQTATSEMAYLLYVTLGNKAFCTPGTNCTEQLGWGLTNVGNFQNMQSRVYWSDLEYALDYAWNFSMPDGSQDPILEKTNQFYAMAVRPGDVTVASVPEPDTLVLAIAALAGLGLVRRRRAV